LTHGEGSGLLGCADPVPELLQPTTANAAKAAPANTLMVRVIVVARTGHYD
jgi:hypothetical protein